MSKTRLIALIVLLPTLLLAAEAPPPAPATKQELMTALQLVQTEKDKYIARYNWGQMMVDEAGRMLSDLAQREQNLMGLLKQMEDAAAKAPAKAPEAKK
jgi:hypothetical protein